MRRFPLSKVYSLVEPGPVVLLTTAHRGRPNVMTMSWLVPLEFEPPLVGVVVSAANHSFAALRRTRECVIALPPASLAATVVKAGNLSGRDGDKFAATGLTPLPAAEVKAPLIAECFANLECRVRETREVNRHNLFVVEVVRAWADRDWASQKTLHHRGHGVFAVDGELLRLKSAMA